MCEECNIEFIGPNWRAIELMGNKAMAREIMKKADVPVVPGYEGEIESPEFALKIAKNRIPCNSKGFLRWWWKRNKNSL